MSNRSYNPTSIPVFRGLGSSASIRNEFAAIGVGMAELETELNARSTQAEWVNPGFTVVYSAANQFVWTGVDATVLMPVYRRVRVTNSGVISYSEVVSAVYSGGNTVVTILDSILTTGLTLVEHSFLTPYGATASTLSTPQFNASIAAEVTIQIASEVAARIAALVPIEVDTTAGNVVKTLPTTVVHASYVKTTNDVNVVTFTTSDGSTIAETVSIDTQYGRVSFDKVGTVWYRG